MKTASTELVGPLNDVIGEINKAGQYTDVSGALGTAVNGQLGKLDPGLVMPSGAFEGGDTYTINGSSSTSPVSYSTDQKPVLAHRLTQNFKFRIYFCHPIN